MMAEGTSEESSTHGKVEAALAHLKPIRDLAKNWDIDIASFLEDCLEELIGHHDGPDVLSQTSDSVDPDAPPPNFAQAALLLQNSSHVYSRKVEYLHSLVYAALHELISSTGQDQKRTKRTGAVDADVEEFLDFDPENEFLLLDDVLPTDNTIGGTKINLPHDDSSMLNIGTTPRFSLIPGSGGKQDTTNTQLSLGGLSVTRFDRSSMGTTLADHTTQANRAALMGSVLNDGTDTHGVNLRLLNGRCDLDESGALLMPGSGIVASNNNRDASRASAGFNRESLHPDANTTGVEVNGQPDDGGFAFNNDDDDHHEGHGFDFSEGDNANIMEQERTSASPNPVTTYSKPEVPDPWTLMDPHDAGDSKQRPIRIGTTYRLPEGFDEPPSSSVTGARTRRGVSLMAAQRPQRKSQDHICIASETFEAVMTHRSRVAEGLEDEDSRPTPASVPLKGLVFGDEFAYIAKAQTKRKAAERRERRKLLKANPSAVPAQEAETLLGLNDKADMGGLDDFGGDDDDDFGGGFANDDAVGIVGNAGIASIDDALSNAMDENDRGTTHSSNIYAETFEALCRAHVKAFTKGAEKYAAETNLSRRVGNWQEKLAPILEEEDKRPVFDIQEYGDLVVDKLEKEMSKNKVRNKRSTVSTQEMGPVDFQVITKNCEQYEVCRMFVVSLMLSNSGNVDMIDDNNSNSSGLKLELLDSDLDYPMETYMAPSAVEEGVTMS